MAPTRLLSCVCARPPLPCSRTRPELHAGDHVDLQNRRPPCAATHTTTTPERTRPSWQSRSRGCRCSSSELACRCRLELARTSTSLYAILQIWWPAGLPLHQASRATNFLMPRQLFAPLRGPHLPLSVLSTAFLLSVHRTGSQRMRIATQARQASPLNCAG
jgi:hypothetical protein